MKRGFLALLALIAMAIGQSAWPMDVQISTGAYPPWSGEKLPFGGCANRIVREAFRREGVTVHFRYVPWPRAMAMLRSGEVAASSYWAHDPVRDKDFLLSDSLFEDRWLLFHLRTTPLPPWQRLSDLSAFRFGLTRSYTYTRELWDLVNKGVLKAEIAPDDATNLHNLLAGLVDIVPMDQYSGWLLLSSVPATAAARNLVTTDEQALNITPAYLLIIKNANGDHLRALFNAGLAQMKADGTLKSYQQTLTRNSASAPK